MSTHEISVFESRKFGIWIAKFRIQIVKFWYSNREIWYSNREISVFESRNFGIRIAKFRYLNREISYSNREILIFESRNLVLKSRNLFRYLNREIAVFESRNFGIHDIPVPRDPMGRSGRPLRPIFELWPMLLSTLTSSPVGNEISRGVRSGWRAIGIPTNVSKPELSTHMTDRLTNGI
jgi:hypothetical protein